MVVAVMDADLLPLNDETGDRSGEVVVGGGVGVEPVWGEMSQRRGRCDDIYESGNCVTSSGRGLMVNTHLTRTSRGRSWRDQLDRSVLSYDQHYILEYYPFSTNDTWSNEYFYYVLVYFLCLHAYLRWNDETTYHFRKRIAIQFGR